MMKRTDHRKLFIELVQVSLGVVDKLTQTPCAEEWQVLYKMANEQSLVGICFAGVQRLVNTDTEKYCGMSEMQYFTWMGMAAKVQQRNEVMNGKTNEALAFFRSKGFPCYVLKGQGIAKLYGSLAGLRQSGDIDVWLNGGREKVYKLSMDVLGRITGANYHHIHFPMWDDPEIEAHIYPSFLCSPLRNHRLHQFANMYLPVEGCEDTPPMKYNLVYIMLHCYRHVCGHGVGMRQLMDYFFVLRNDFTDDERKEALRWCKKLGMRRFIGAMMWVQQELFGLEEKYMLCKPDEEEGRFVLNEVFHTGNMGHSETRFNWNNHTHLTRFIANQRHGLHIITHYPHEVCWNPFFNIALFIWRKYRGLIDYD